MARHKAEQRRSWKTILSALLFAFGFFYLTFHALNGERGFYALLKEERKRDVLQEELTKIRAEREQLERQSSGLSAESLDLDLLDERARMVLGSVSPDELLIYLPERQ